MEEIKDYPLFVLTHIKTGAPLAIFSHLQQAQHDMLEAGEGSDLGGARINFMAVTMREISEEEFDTLRDKLRLPPWKGK